MIYSKELLEYMKHFPMMQIWDSDKVTDDVSYNDIAYLIEDAEKDGKLYEIQTKLSNIKYLDGDEIKDAFGIAIDIDTKDRDKGITIENLTDCKRVASKLVEGLSSYGLTSVLKFSGGGYHILLFFDYTLLGDYLEIKDFQINVIAQMIKRLGIDKSSVKDIEIKHDQIRSLFSYNRKYNNYSVPSEINQPVEIDIDASNNYKKFNFVFEKAVNISFPNNQMLNVIKQAEDKKQSNNKFRNVSVLVEQAIETLHLESKEHLNDNDISKIVELVKPKVKESPNYIAFVSKSIIKYRKSITLYDDIYSKGVKDGRKRLLVFIIMPYLNIKFNNDKTKMEQEAYKWLNRSGVTNSELYKYRNEINSLLTNMQSGIRPTSIPSLLARFGITKDEFINNYVNK